MNKRKKRLPSRKRRALQSLLLALLLLLAATQVFHICLLPGQAVQLGQESWGVPGPSAVLHRARIPGQLLPVRLYLTGNERYTGVFGASPSPLGWESWPNSAIDCTGDAPLFLGELRHRRRGPAWDRDRSETCTHILFGRIDDPAIASLAVYRSFFPEDGASEPVYTDPVFLGEEDFLEAENGARYLLSLLPADPDGLYASSRVEALDGEGRVLLETELLISSCYG